MKVITTKRTAKRIRDICRHGTKRQRAKYRNAYVTICKGGHLVGIHYGHEVADPKAELRFDRAERRRGVPVPIFRPDGRMCEPCFHGVKGRRGLFWNLDVWCNREMWYGRNDWHRDRP